MKQGVLIKYKEAPHVPIGGYITCQGVQRAQFDLSEPNRVFQRNGYRPLECVNSTGKLVYDWFD